MRVLILILFWVVPNTILAQLEFELTSAYDISRMYAEETESYLIGIPNQFNLIGSYGFGANVYNFVNSKTRLGVGISIFEKKEIKLIDGSFAFNPRTKFQFKDLRASLGLKQVLSEQIFFKLNLNLHAVFKPSVQTLYGSNKFMDVRRVFYGPELGLGYSFKNILLEVYGFKSIGVFADDVVLYDNRFFNVNSLSKTFSFGIKLGYILHYPRLNQNK